ncbi:MAG: clostripain-related cysteine peptidase [Fimbriimonadaceae bacterium]
MKRAWLIVVAFGAALLAGCGGGGGGGGDRTVSDFVYTTDWVAGSSGPTGRSQRLSLVDSNGIVRWETVINREVDGLQAQPLASVPTGDFRLVAQLYSERDAAGVQTGLLTASVEVAPKGAFQTAVGAPPASLRVQPSSLALQPPASARLVATPLAADQRPVFVAPDSLGWSSSAPAVATVDEDGIVQALAAGEARIEARHIPTGVSASAPVVVSPSSAERTKWTILVFLNGANDLAEFSVKDMNEMERAAQNPQVRVVVQWKLDPSYLSSGGFRGTRRYLIKPDSSSSIRSELVQDLGERVDMGRATTLRDFVQWGMQNYPADRFGLIVWNHGNGWLRSATAAASRAISYDDLTGNAIQVWQLGSALQGRRFDFIAWDASLMQMLEVAYEVRGFTDFVVGSQESPPGDGYPYEAVLRRFRDDPDAPTGTLVRSFVDAMLEEPAYANRKITQSVLRTSALAEVARAVDVLGAALAANASQLGATMARVRSTTQAYSPSDYRHFYDLLGLARNLEDAAGVPAIVAAAGDVRRAVQAAVAYERHNAQSPGSNGVSIDLTPKDRWSASALADYRRLQLGADTRWDEWLAVAP